MSQIVRIPEKAFNDQPLPAIVDIFRCIFRTLRPVSAGHELSSSRRIRARALPRHRPRRTRGSREGRVAAAPGALAPENVRKGRVTTGTGGDTPAFPARWFTAYTRSPR